MQVHYWNHAVAPLFVCVTLVRSSRSKNATEFSHLVHNQSAASVILTHCGRVTHICVSKPTTIGSDNGLSPGRRQAIIWINAGILLIRTLGTNFSEILDKIHSFSFSKMQLKMSSAKWRLFGLGLNELMDSIVLASHLCTRVLHGQLS